MGTSVRNLKGKGSTVREDVNYNPTSPTLLYTVPYMGQCPAKSGLWGYNFITIKIGRCTKQHIFATVQSFPFTFCTLVPTPLLCVKIDFCDLDIFRAMDATIVNPAG